MEYFKIVLIWVAENKNSGLKVDYRDTVYVKKDQAENENDAKCIAQNYIVTMESLQSYITFTDIKIA